MSDTCEYFPVKLCLERPISNGSGGSGFPIYPGMFMSFMEQTPPDGWKARFGETIQNADVAYPALWAELQKPGNAWKVKTDEEWAALSTAAGGVGGVPFFAVNFQNKLIRLPDTRGDYERGIGGGSMSSVGEWHGDAIRNIEGSAGEFMPRGRETVSGAFEKNSLGVWDGLDSKTMITATRTIKLNASLVVPTASENRTRAFGMLPCVYVGEK